MNSAVTMYFDGAASLNVSPMHPFFTMSRAAWAFVALGNAGMILKESARPMPANARLNAHFERDLFRPGCGTNNMAEFEAAYQALKWAHEMGYRHVRLKGDSQLVLATLTGEFRIPKDPWLADPTRRIAELIACSVEDAPAADRAYAKRLRLARHATADRLIIECIKVSDRKNRADRLARVCVGDTRMRHNRS